MKNTTDSIGILIVPNSNVICACFEYVIHYLKRIWIRNASIVNEVLRGNLALLSIQSVSIPEKVWFLEAFNACF